MSNVKTTSATLNAAFLVGIHRYPDHALKGVSNDLVLLSRGLRRHRNPASALHTFDNSYATQAQLHSLLSHIRADYEGVERGTCLLYISASGALSLDPLRGGVLPTDGLAEDFRTCLPFDALGAYLPVRPGIHVSVIVDT